MIELTFNSQKLKPVLQRLILSTYKLSNRPELTGIHIQINNEEVTLTAADGYMLGEYKLKIEYCTVSKLEVILPLQFVKDVTKEIKNKDILITFIFDNNFLSVWSYRTKSIKYKLIKSTYPDYGNYDFLCPDTYNNLYSVELTQTQIKNISDYVLKLKVGERKKTQVWFNFEDSLMVGFVKPSDDGYILTKSYSLPNIKLLIKPNMVNDYVIECTQLFNILKYLPSSSILNIIFQPEIDYKPVQIQTSDIRYIIMPIHKPQILYSDLVKPVSAQQVIN